MRSLIPILLIAAAAGAGWYFFTPSPPAVPQPRPVPPAPQPAPAEDPKPHLTVETRQAPKVTQAPDPDGGISLPGGGYLPTLNGVKARARLPIPGAFVGVKKTIVDQDGLEWYVLNNGDYLTTCMKPGIDRGRPVTRAILVHLQEAEVTERLKALAPPKR